LRRKSLLQKLLFKWFKYTGGGRIFLNGVMHANMAKCGDMGVIDILAVDAYSGVELCLPMFFWVRLANNVGSKSFLIFFKTQMDTSLNKAQHKQELLCKTYLALVGMCMSLMNLPKFIQL
jgi:hypothetical protein